jgi:hypothetical protein
MVKVRLVYLTKMYYDNIVLTYFNLVLLSNNRMTYYTLIAISQSAERYLEYKAFEYNFYNIIGIGILILSIIYYFLKVFNWIWNKICDFFINL